MKYKYIVLLFIIGLSCYNSGFGQENNKNIPEHSLFIGYPLTIYYPSKYCVYLSYNQALLLNRYFGLEFQLSYSHIAFKEFSFYMGPFGGDRKEGIANIANLMGGMRLNIFKGRIVNPYINILGGLSYTVSKELGEPVKKKLFYAFSPGIYFQLYNRFNFGVALEFYTSAVIKAGYTF